MEAVLKTVTGKTDGGSNPSPAAKKLAWAYAVAPDTVQMLTVETL